MIQEQECSAGGACLYLFICFFLEESQFVAFFFFFSACIARDCPLIPCFIVCCELNTTGVQEPLRAQHPFCCSCPQPAELTGTLLFMVCLFPK